MGRLRRGPEALPKLPMCPPAPTPPGALVPSVLRPGAVRGRLVQEYRGIARGLGAGHGVLHSALDARRPRVVSPLAPCTHAAARLCTGTRPS
eukprot:scaffold96198_cov69-Phaeocystis_antarctica.AAC.3